MDSYDERLAQRQEAAEETDSAYVRHFGPEAEKYNNWARLWLTGWQEELENPMPTPSYQPRGLPRDEAGNMITGGAGEYGRPLPPDPSLYSPKFLYVLAQAVAYGGPHVAAAISSSLKEGDEVDFDRATEVLDKLAIYLSGYSLWSIDGTGRAIRIDSFDQAQIDFIFLHWNERKGASDIFITHYGIAVPNQPVVPYEVVQNVLQAARQQVQARRIEYAKSTQMLAALTAKKADKKKLSLPVLALVLVYEGKYLQRDSKADELAVQAGHNSGDKLYQKFTEYSKPHNRTGFDNETAIKGRNMIKRIQKALPELSSKARQKAENEISMIKAKIA